MGKRVALGPLAVAIAMIPLLTSCLLEGEVSCDDAIGWDEARQRLGEEWTTKMVVTGPVVAAKAGFERRPSEAGLFDESWTKAQPLLMLGQGSWEYQSGFLVIVDSDDFPEWWYLTWGDKSEAEVEARMRRDLLGKTVCVRGGVQPYSPKSAQMTIDSRGDIRILEIEDAAR